MASNTDILAAMQQEDMRPVDLMQREDSERDQLSRQSLEENSQKLRTAFQGMTFGGADEAEAFIRSFTSDKGYDEILSGIRKDLHDYSEKNPGEALAYEIGGAALPTIVASVFTGGGAAAAQSTRLFPSLAKFTKKLLGAKDDASKLSGFVPSAVKGAKIGAVEGGLYGFGSSEGDLSDRSLDAVSGAVFGGATGGALNFAGEGLKMASSSLLDTARGLFGQTGSKAVRAELDRLVKETGKSVDEIVSDVASGRLMIENKTLFNTIKAYKNQGGEQGARIAKETELRSEKTQDQVIDEINKRMTNLKDPNLSRGMSDLISSERALESAARQPYATRAANVNVRAALRDTIKRMPEAVKLAAQDLKLQTGSDSLYKIDGAGSVILNPKITEAQAEAIMAQAGQVAQSYGEKTMTKRLAPSAFKVQEDLRKVIDENIEGMAGIRATSASTFAKEDAFNLGQKLKSKSVDEAAFEIEKLLASNPEAIDALRTGVLASFKMKTSQRGGKASLIKVLNQEGSKERELLLNLFPDDSIDEIINKIDIAAGAKDVQSFMAGQSATQGITEANRRIGQGGEGLIDEVLNISNPANAARIANRLLSGLGVELKDSDKEKVLDVLLSSNPNDVLEALTDKTMSGAVWKNINNVISSSIGGAAQGTARVSGGIGNGLLSGL